MFTPAPLRRLPAFAAARAFSTTNPTFSKVGLAPIAIPSTVTLATIQTPSLSRRIGAGTKIDTSVIVTGPLGSLTLPLPTFAALTFSADKKKVTMSVTDPKVRAQREMWGTARSLLQNHITGVSEGHVRVLRLVGVGYRATIEDEGRIVNLKVQYAHPVELKVPVGVKASVPQPTRILLEGLDRQVVSQFAADIRSWRVPEPYKGKGIFVDQETIRLKNRKIK